MQSFTVTCPSSILKAAGRYAGMHMGFSECWGLGSLLRDPGVLLPCGLLGRRTSSCRELLLKVTTGHVYCTGIAVLSMLEGSSPSIHIGGALGALHVGFPEC